MGKHILQFSYELAYQAVVETSTRTLVNDFCGVKIYFFGMITLYLLYFFHNFFSSWYFADLFKVILQYYQV